MSPSEARQPLFTLRPKFAPTQTVLEALLVGIAATLVLTAIGGTILVILFSFIGLGKFISGSTIYSIIFLGTLLSVPAIYYEAKRKLTKKTHYKFFTDNMEFVHFGKLFNLRQGRLRYQDVTDIVQRSNILEQRDKVQTIYIWAPSFGFTDRQGFTGVKLENISKNPKIMQTIEQVILREDNPIAVAPSASAQQEPLNAPPVQNPGSSTTG